jgi:hypothetical protein
MLREAAAVLAAILVAFALDAWWDARNEREAGVIAMESLKTEIEDNLIALDSTLVRNEGTILAHRDLATITPGEMASLSDDEILERFAYGGAFLDMQPETGALSVLLDSNLLTTIRDPDLRSAIAGMPQGWEEVAEDGDIATELWVDAIRAIGPAADPEVLYASLVGPGRSGISPSVTRSIAQDDTYRERALAASIFTRIYVDEMTGLRATLQGVLAQLESELAR